ncbi:hypothetical protein RYZ26_00410 [Terasakiella sp. A23]|uniref:hypothetical protein n=1 Tax=Terasakiella sp. FCG-A23 TaxID=3080561 RepID=UPI002955C3A8|nr:hypothetical protein [Terasakiella sp. A23]MDV7338035.1 hypothetical protein [Terasakiella sp. A23]
MRLILSVLLLTLASFAADAADIVDARFSLPTERYDHCVLGDCIEYGAVEAIMDDGNILAFRLDEDSVFEDITPRLIPMGLNGRKAILVVRSYLDRGAALALLEVRGGKLKIAAESEAIGTAHRWQNPIGTGDFDRDGKLEIASVIKPHLSGHLTLFERRGSKLVIDKSTFAYSNHKLGSSELDLHEIMDWNGDKTPDIILPDVTRTGLKVVTFQSGEAEVIAEQKYNSLILGPVTATETGVQLTLVDGNEETWDK